MAKELVFVVFSNRYDFEADNGQKLKGSNLHYITFNQDDLSDNGAGYGKKLNKLNMNYADCELFKEGTGVYEITYEVGLATKGKPDIKEAKLMESIDFNSFFEKHIKKQAI